VGKYPENDSGIEAVLKRFISLEEHSPDSTLVMFVPDPADLDSYRQICSIWAAPAAGNRNLIKKAVLGRKGILNRLLGYAHYCCGRFSSTADSEWLTLGLASAAIQNGELDHRDHLMAMAELFETALDLEIDPVPFFEAAGGGVPPDFHNYAVVRCRLIDLERIRRKS